MAAPEGAEIVTQDVSPDTTTLTTAYASGWASDWVTLSDFDFQAIRMDFGVTKGDATTIEIALETSPSASGSGYVVWGYGTDASPDVGTYTLHKKEWVLTAADLSTTDTVSFRYRLRRSKRFRIIAKKTGGSGTVSLSASVTFVKRIV